MRAASSLLGLLLVSGACTRPSPPPAAEPAPDLRPLVVVLGDSLTAGQGVALDQAFPAVLERDLAAGGLAVRVVNAGVSGDTTAGGLARARWVLSRHPAVLVVALGANDGLRGLPTDEMERNLRAIVDEGRTAGAAVILCGMRVPPSMGPDYSARFADVFVRVARDLQLPLVPFLLEGVAADPALNQADGIHPTAKGHELLAANVLPFVEQAMRETLSSRSPAARSSGTP